MLSHVARAGYSCHLLLTPTPRPASAREHRASEAVPRLRGTSHSGYPGGAAATADPPIRRSADTRLGVLHCVKPR
jgi:hypothetical protein